MPWNLIDTGTSVDSNYEVSAPGRLRGAVAGVDSTQGVRPRPGQYYLAMEARTWKSFRCFNKIDPRPDTARAKQEVEDHLGLPPGSAEISAKEWAATSRRAGGCGGRTCRLPPGPGRPLKNLIYDSNSTTATGRHVNAPDGRAASGPGQTVKIDASGSYQGGGSAALLPLGLEPAKAFPGPGGGLFHRLPSKM